MKKNNYRLKFPLRNDLEKKSLDKLNNLLNTDSFSHIERILNFPIYSPRQNLASFLFKYEIFKKILNVHGSIIECGVAFGSGSFTFAKLSSIFEPSNFNRKIYGFDTFEGFKKISKKDHNSDPHAYVGGMKVDSFQELTSAIEIFDMNRFNGHIPKVEFIKGDIKKTAKYFLKKHPECIISLLYLDFDLYEPTLAALENFLPRMPKGSIIVFDELNHPDWPGETKALLEKFDLNTKSLKRFSFDSVRSYIILD